MAAQLAHKKDLLPPQVFFKRKDQRKLLFLELVLSIVLPSFIVSMLSLSQQQSIQKKKIHCSASVPK